MQCSAQHTWTALLLVSSTVSWVNTQLGVAIVASAGHISQATEVPAAGTQVTAVGGLLTTAEQLK